MGTACRIGRMTPNGMDVKWVRWNGSRSYMEPILAVCYSDPKKVDQLFNNGNISTVRARPMLPYNLLACLELNATSKVVVDAIHYLTGTTMSLNCIGCEGEDPGVYNSPKEFIDEYNYFYDYKSNSWYVGIRDKNDFYNRDKIKVEKCKGTKKDVFENDSLYKMLKYAEEGHYVLLKDCIEYAAPVTIHQSRGGQQSKYYITLGGKQYYPVGHAYDLQTVPTRKDTGEVVYRCNTLEELITGTVSVLLKLK